MAESETERERINRNFAELLQEVRVSQTGIQVLFGFLLAIAFTPQVESLGQSEKWIYAATVLSSTIAMALNMAPVAVHRATFRRHMKETVVRVSHRLTLAALVFLFLAFMGGLYLALTMVFTSVRVPLTIISSVVFGLAWLVLPRVMRAHSTN